MLPRERGMDSAQLKTFRPKHQHQLLTITILGLLLLTTTALSVHAANQIKNNGTGIYQKEEKLMQRTATATLCHVILRGRENNDALLPLEGWRLQIPAAMLPQDYFTKSMTYAAVDLLNNPLKMNDGDSTEIVLTLAHR